MPSISASVAVRVLLAEVARARRERRDRLVGARARPPVRRKLMHRVVALARGRGRCRCRRAPASTCRSEPNRSHRRTIASAPRSSNSGVEQDVRVPAHALIFSGLPRPCLAPPAEACHPNQMLLRDSSMSTSASWMRSRIRLGLVHHHAGRVALLVGRNVEGHRLEHAQVELGGEEEDEAGGPEQQHVGGHRHVRAPGGRAPSRRSCTRSASPPRSRRPRSARPERPHAWPSRRTRPDRTAAGDSARPTACPCPWCPRDTRGRDGPRRAGAGGRSPGAAATPPIRAKMVPRTGTDQNV